MSCCRCCLASSTLTITSSSSASHFWQHVIRNSSSSTKQMTFVKEFWLMFEFKHVHVLCHHTLTLTLAPSPVPSSRSCCPCLCLDAVFCFISTSLSLRWAAAAYTHEHLVHHKCNTVNITVIIAIIQMLNTPSDLHNFTLDLVWLNLVALLIEANNIGRHTHFVFSWKYLPSHSKMLFWIWLY